MTTKDRNMIAAGTVAAVIIVFLFVWSSRTPLFIELVTLRMEILCLSTGIENGMSWGLSIQLSMGNVLVANYLLCHLILRPQTKWLIAMEVNSYF